MSSRLFEFAYLFIPSSTSMVALGLTRLAVPTAIAFAPAIMNSMASSPGHDSAKADDRKLCHLCHLINHADGYRFDSGT